MKKLLLIFVFIFITSCKENKEAVLKSEIEEKIKLALNDPDSYEFDYFQIDSSYFLASQNLLKEYKNDLNKSKSSSKKKLIQKEIIRQQILAPKYKFNGVFRFRGTNNFGAKILTEFKFEANDKYKLIYLIDNLNDTIYEDSY